MHSHSGKRNRLVKKTAEHLEAERNLRGRIGEELKMAIRNLAKHRRKYRATRIKKKKNQNEGTTCDKQKWEEELERYSGD